MRDLIYTFEDGRVVYTYEEAKKIAGTEGIKFVADVRKVEPTFKVAKPGAVREKYIKFFTKG